jgi:hypothetical protein
MEVTTFKLAEVLKEDRHKGGNILGSLLCRALANKKASLPISDRH